MKRISVRLADDQLKFLKELEKRGIERSSGIRFCIDLVRLTSETKTFDDMIKQFEESATKLTKVIVKDNGKYEEKDV